MADKIYPASGLLPIGAHFQEQRDDQGKDFVTNWRGIIQAPGAGHCVSVNSDRPFPNGFGPRYPIVRIDTGPYKGHDWYIGHCTSLVSPGEHFTFGKPLARADQGHNFNGSNGGWVEFGEWGPLGPYPNRSSHWYSHLITHNLVIKDPVMHEGIGNNPKDVFLLTHRLAVAGWLSHSGVFYSHHVAQVIKKYQQFHKLPVSLHGDTDSRTWLAVKHSADWCKLHHKKEIPTPL